MKTVRVYLIPLKCKLEYDNDFIPRSICLQKKAKKLMLN